MISVIVPTLNEEAHLPATLASLRAQSLAHEVIVVDAGSSDATRSIAAESGARIVESEVRQRAAQMNLGASVASGDVLHFLHADTLLPPDAFAKMERALRQSTIVGGGFARRYDLPSATLRCTCALAELRTRCFGWFLGDQAIFVRRVVFENLREFREWDAFEDLDFARRLSRIGKVVTLRPPVISAGRRFTRRGALRTTWNDLRLTIRYLAAGRIRTRQGLENPRASAAVTSP